ncbi:MAG: NAD-dependent dehydratase, partial [Pseudomonas orientalis]|nr:NAD-dependent dehydratase [Pseudomonas orientalis]
QAVWTQIVAERGLKESDISRLISPWHTDADLGRPIEVVTDMSKSRALGFTAYQASDQAFFDVFDQLRQRRLIP